MLKHTDDDNIMLRQAQMRRGTWYVFLFCVIGISAVCFHGYFSGWKTTAVQMYKPYINSEGVFQLYPGHKIMMHVVENSSPQFSKLWTYLTQSELRNYFAFVPFHNYHVTLTTLVNISSSDDAQILLRQEQETLDFEELLARGIAKQVAIVDKEQLRLVIEFNESIEKKLKSYQQRWSNTFKPFIDEHRTSLFHITLAYQYKDIPNSKTRLLLEEILKNWQVWPFEIEFDPIEICSYSDLTNITPMFE